MYSVEITWSGGRKYECGMSSTVSYDRRSKCIDYVKLMAHGRENVRAWIDGEEVDLITGKPKEGNFMDELRVLLEAKVIAKRALEKHETISGVERETDDQIAWDIKRRQLFNISLSADTAYDEAVRKAAKP